MNKINKKKSVFRIFYLCKKKKKCTKRTNNIYSKAKKKPTYTL